MRNGLGLRARVLIVAILSASFVGGNVATPEPAQATTSLEYRLARYHNNARASRGLRKLAVDSSLSYKARAHTRAMIRKGKLYHSYSLPRAYGSGEGYWRYLGENVGYASSVWKLHEAFMRSYGHRRNILKSAYRRIGVGIVRSGSRYWVTVAFLG